MSHSKATYSLTGDSARPQATLRLHILALLIIGVIPRAILTVSSFALTWSDSWAYSRWAFNIATRGDFFHYPIYRTPLYPMFLSLFYMAFGAAPPIGEAIVCVQRLLGMSTGIFIYFIARKTTRTPRIAFLAASMYLLLPRVLYYETTILTEALFTFLLAAAVLWTVSLLERPADKAPALWHLVGLALLLALLTLTRPLGQFLPILFACLLVARFGRALIIPAAIFLLSFLVFLLPWIVVNKKVSGFIGISKDQGLNFYHKVIDVDKALPLDETLTAYPQVHALYEKARTKPGVTYFHVYHGLLRARIRPAKVDSLMGGFALETFQHNKSTFFLNSVKLLGQFFFKTRNSVLRCQVADQPPFLCSNLQGKGMLAAFPNYPHQLSQTGRRITAWYMRHLAPPDWLFGWLAVAGLVLVGCRARFPCSGVWCLALVIMYFAGLTAIFNWAEDRFRVPIDGFFAIFAAAFLHRAGQALLSGLTQRTQG